MKGLARMLFVNATWRPKPLPDQLDLSGQTALITGANGGLGLEAAKDLAAHGLSRLLLCARDLSKEAAIRKEIQGVNADCKVELWGVDYDDYNSLLECGKNASALERLDLAVLNAGVRQPQFERTKTGHEQNLAVNHVGTALLSLLLEPVLSKTAEKFSKPSRLTIVTSIMHWWTAFNEYQAPSILHRMDEEDSLRGRPLEERYATSKLLNILWARLLASKVDGQKVIINCVDPGLCDTALHRRETRLVSNIIIRIFAFTMAQGGYNISNAAAGQGPKSHGQYISEQTIKEPSDFVVSDKGKDAQTRVWAETTSLLQKEVPGLEMPVFA